MTGATTMGKNGLTMSFLGVAGIGGLLGWGVVVGIWFRDSFEFLLGVSCAGALLGALAMVHVYWSRRRGEGTQTNLPHAPAETSGGPEALHQALAALGRAETIDGMMGCILAEIQTLAPYKTAVLYVAEPKTEVLAPQFVHGDNVADFQDLRIQPCQGVTGWAVANRRIMAVAHPELDFFPDQHRMTEDYNGAAVFPLTSLLAEGEGCPGALTLYFGQMHTLSPENEKRLQQIAACIGDRVRTLGALKAAQAAALSDPVTHLPNHRYMYAYISQELARARRHTYPFSLLEMEIENYRGLVEQEGQEAVNDLLRELAHTLRRQLRDSDVVARLSETEFSALLSMTSHSQAVFLVRRLQNAADVFRYQTRPGVLVQVRMSIGCADFPEHGRTSEALFLRAGCNRRENRSTTPESQTLGLRQMGGNVIPFQS